MNEEDFLRWTWADGPNQAARTVCVKAWMNETKGIEDRQQFATSEQAVACCK